MIPAAQRALVPRDAHPDPGSQAHRLDWPLPISRLIDAISADPFSGHSHISGEGSSFTVARPFDADERGDTPPNQQR